MCRSWVGHDVFHHGLEGLTPLLGRLVRVAIGENGSGPRAAALVRAGGRIEQHVAQSGLLVLQLGQTGHHLVFLDRVDVTMLHHLALQLRDGAEFLRARRLQLGVLRGHRLAWLFRLFWSGCAVWLNLDVHLTVWDVIDADFPSKMRGFAACWEVDPRLLLPVCRTAFSWLLELLTESHVCTDLIIAVHITVYKVIEELFSSTLRINRANFAFRYGCM